MSFELWPVKERVLSPRRLRSHSLVLMDLGMNYTPTDADQCRQAEEESLVRIETRGASEYDCIRYIRRYRSPRHPNRHHIGTRCSHSPFCASNVNIMDRTPTTQIPPVSDGQPVSRRGVAKPQKYSSPPRANSVVSMLRSLSLDDDYFERRALRAKCVQRTPLDDFHPQASEIVPGLFVCDIYTATSPAVVRGLGITHVASVIKHDCPQFPKPMQHLWIPIDDSRHAELLGHLDFVVEWIVQALEQKGQVMVHCVWGMSRSASVAIAYLMAVEKMPFDIACKHVILRRKVVRPNSGFMRQLKAYEQILSSRGQRRHSV